MDQESPPKAREKPKGIGALWGSLFSRSETRPTPPAARAPSPPLTPQDLALVKAAYLRRLQANHRTVYIYGLDERRHTLQRQGCALELEALYTPLNTTQSTAAPAEPPDAGTYGSMPRTRPVSLIEAAGKERHLLVRGSLGSARSTFLKRLALSMAEAGGPDDPAALSRLGPEWTHGQLFPLLIDLGDFALSTHGQAKPGADDLLDYIAAQLGIESEQAATQLITPGGVLFLIDNLECAPDAARDFWCRFAGHDNVWIVTAPSYLDLDDAAVCKLEDFVQVTVADLTIEQMDGFVRQWYAELARKGWIDEESARDLPGQLCALLRRPDIKMLARRRSLLLLIALLHTLQGRLAASRTRFHYELVKLTLAHWIEGRDEIERDLRPAFNMDRLVEAIAQTTYQAYTRLEHQADMVELQEHDLRAALTRACREGLWPMVNELVLRLRTRPGLLEERRPGVLSFAHPTLQAYAISRHLVIQPELPRLAVRLAQDNFYRWRESILFAVGRLSQLQDDLAAALDIVDALCPQPISEPTRAQDSAWRLAWLAGQCLVEIERGFASQEQPFPPHAASSLARIKSWLAATLEQEQLAPHERAQAGRTLSRLPASDERAGVCEPEGLWCEVPASPFWHGEGDDAQLIEQAGFWIARYPVTNAQYARFVEATRRKSPAHWSGSRPSDDIRNHPVVNVTWQDAMDYCQWLAERLRASPFRVWRQGHIEAQPRPLEGLVVRLPTSLEWEKAARGGLPDNPLPRRTYPWGDSWTLSSIEKPGDETRCNVSESNIGTTTPVGMYPSGASPYGVLDMAGNVWEWCHNWAYAETRYKARRGGAFRYTHDQARCSAIDKAHPGLAWPYMGFRVVLGPPLPQDRP